MGILAPKEKLQGIDIEADPLAGECDLTWSLEELKDGRR